MISDSSDDTAAKNRLYNYAILGYCLGASGLTVALSTAAAVGVV